MSRMKRRRITTKLVGTVEDGDALDATFTEASFSVSDAGLEAFFWLSLNEPDVLEMGYEDWGLIETGD